jgi:hypothetical protein
MQFEKLLTAVVAVMVGIIGVAALTALVSSKSQTPSVVGAFSTGFACTLRTAISGKNECEQQGVGTGKFCVTDSFTGVRTCTG